MMRLKGALLGAALSLFAFAPAQAATCYISEFTQALIGGIQAAAQPALVDQTVAIGGSSTQSNAFSGNTRLIRLTCDAVASYKIGGNPTASATTARIAADVIEYFVVTPGDKIAIITNS